MNDKTTNNQRITEIIIEEMTKNPDASINELCRVCKARHVKVDKQLVASVRRKVIKAAVNATPGDYIPGKGFLVEIKPPAAFAREEVTHANPAEVANEIAEKRDREAAREAEWRKREAEREAQWTAEREAERAAAEVAREALARENQRQAEAAAACVASPPGWPTGPGEPVRPLEVTPRPMEQFGSPGDPSVIVAPRKRGTAHERAMRRQRLNELLDVDPGADPVALMAKLRAEFGGGLDWSYVYDTCRVAREVHGLPTIPTRDDSAGRTGGSPRPLPTFPVTDEIPTEAQPGTDPAVFADTPEEDLRWLAEQAQDIMRAHNLVELVLTMNPDGGEWEFKVAPRVGRGSLSNRRSP